MKSKCYIYQNGTKVWKNYKREYHREDGPAVIYTYGLQVWYKNDKLHRLNGPAFEWDNGTKRWFRNGRIYVETI